MTEYGPWLGDEQISMAESFIKILFMNPDSPDVSSTRN
ncbi:MAG: hypothetical protein CM15mP90_5420 [Actinomycetota bacterium]|nr:MAG: hypothetical protein CM15mP90_5420 [Actinomycetota bacterium]